MFTYPPDIIEEQANGFAESLAIAIQANTKAEMAQSDSITSLQTTIDRYAQAWMSRDVDRIAALHTTESVFFLNVAGHPPALGRKAIRAKFQQILRGNPHYSSTVHRMSWGIDFVVIEYSIRMQPAGQFVLGQHRLKPKSNIAYDIPAIDVIHVEKGLVNAKYMYVDNETVRANSVAVDDVCKS